MNTELKLGIYGGSFSPPHAGHVSLAGTFLREIGLDRLLIIPAGNPPHKQIDGGADGDARLEMCRAAFAGLSDRVEISDFEAYRTGPCYTVDTLRHFAHEGELFMLCGSDMFLTLPKWREPREIFRLCTVVCGTRTDDPDTARALAIAAEEYRRDYGARTLIMEHDPIEVSSTELRVTLAAGMKPAEIPDGVYDVIRKRGLYI